jgi:hypothetical protein
MRRVLLEAGVETYELQVTQGLYEAMRALPHAEAIDRLMNRWTLDGKIEQLQGETERRQKKKSRRH